MIPTRTATDRIELSETRPRRLLVVSHTPHYRGPGDSSVVGWGPTVRELDRLSTLFEDVVHLAPLHDEPAPASALPYESERIRFLPVRPAGGPRLGDKLGILSGMASWVRSLSQALGSVDAVHVRMPCHLGILALALLSLRREPRFRWFKYAGNWKPDAGAPDPWSYRLQRAWLKTRSHGGWVTVNGDWPDLPPHVVPFLNPCLTDEEVRAAAARAVSKSLTLPLRLIYVGVVSAAKGSERAVRIAAELARLGTDFRLDLVGDGPERPGLERLASELGTAARVRFVGWRPRRELDDVYAEAHGILCPSVSEGWPKVLSEAMAHGVVPLASSVSCIPRMLESSGCGAALPGDDIAGFAREVLGWVRDPLGWQAQSRAAVSAARRFTYESYLERVSDLLDRGSMTNPARRAPEWVGEAVP